MPATTVKTKKHGTRAYVTTRVSKAEKEALDQVAAEERRTLSQIARFAIQEFLTARQSAKGSA